MTCPECRAVNIATHRIFLNVHEETETGATTASYICDLEKQNEDLQLQLEFSNALNASLEQEVALMKAAQEESENNLLQTLKKLGKIEKDNQFLEMQIANLRAGVTDLVVDLTK